MNIIVASLTGLLLSSQAVQAEEVPTGVVKLRTHLEHMRLEVLRENMLLQEVDGSELTDKDQQYIMKHTSQEHASAVAVDSLQLFQDLTTTIVELGGSDKASEEEEASIMQSLMDEQNNIPAKEDIPLFNDSKI